MSQQVSKQTNCRLTFNFSFRRIFFTPLSRLPFGQSTVNAMRRHPSLATRISSSDNKMKQSTSQFCYCHRRRKLQENSCTGSNYDTKRECSFGLYRCTAYDPQQVLLDELGESWTTRQPQPHRYVKLWTPPQWLLLKLVPMELYEFSCKLRLGIIILTIELRKCQEILMLVDWEAGEQLYVNSFAASVLVPRCK